MDKLLKTKNLRLYIALYALHGALMEDGPIGPQTFWWTFLVAPSAAPAEQKCLRYRLRKTRISENSNPSNAHFEKTEWDIDTSLVPLGRHDDIVARVLIAEIEDAKAVDERMNNAWPKETMRAKKSGRVRTSRDWVQRVHEGLGGVSPGSLLGNRYLTSKLADWERIENFCTSWALNLAMEGAKSDEVPTLDLLKS